jgi:hypothetical protein
MRNAGGYSIITEPGVWDIEHDTFTCAHCNAITFTKSKRGGFEVVVIGHDGSVNTRECARCRNCYAHICPRCEGKPCIPFERRLDEMEARARRST